MKPSEAIKTIKRLIRIVELGYNSNPLSKEGEHTTTEALTLAISALEKQEAIQTCTPPSDDWEHYADRLHDIAYQSGYEQGKRDAGNWIPCSERLPEDEYVLISKKPTKLSGSKWSVGIAIRIADPRSGEIQWRDSGFGVIQDDKVLAWMPLPEPYQEGEQDG